MNSLDIWEEINELLADSDYWIRRPKGKVFQLLRDDVVLMTFEENQLSLLHGFLNCFHLNLDFSEDRSELLRMKEINEHRVETINYLNETIKLDHKILKKASDSILELIEEINQLKKGASNEI